MLRNILMTSVALAVISGSAIAADLPARGMAPMPYAPPVFTWTGFYVGASAGYARTTTKSTDYDYAIFGYGATQHLSADGGIFGVDVGYNWQMGALVLGLEADIAGIASNSGSADTYGVGYGQLKSKMTSLGTVRGRLGYAVDRALFYVTGGYAAGQVKSAANYYVNDPYYQFSSSKWQSGWTFGAGIEYAIAPNWTVRAEALYVDLGKKTAVNQCGCRYGFKTTAIVARAGLNYKF
jgi:outer membrane immunogenic protein